jgi:hypothetical protein
MNTKEVESRPESKGDIQTEESKSKTLPKADYLDKTDPNETGRNVAQLIFEQENEDKKATTKPKTTSTSTNSKNGNNNSSSSSNTSQVSSTTSTSTNSKKEVDKTTNDNQVQDNK